MNVAAITFDLDGVYFPKGKKEFGEALAKKYGVAEEDFKRVFLKSEQMNVDYKTGEMTDAAFWKWAINEWGIETNWKEIVELMIAGYGVDKRVKKVISDVRKKGYKTVVCSNNFPARVKGLSEKFKFLDDFDAAIFSFEVGATKPAKRIFEAVEKKDKDSG